MSQFTSRSSSRRRELERRAVNPAATALLDSRQLYSNLTHPTATGRTPAEAIQFVLEREPMPLRDTASYRLLKQLLPLLS